MKKLLCLASVLILALSAFAQESWDAETCHYTNHTWHFHWNLNRELKWEKEQADEPHTAFRVRSPYGLIAFVNIIPFASEEQEQFDFWQNFDTYKGVLEESWRRVEQRTGGTVAPIKVEKCRFFGENAIKILVKTDFHDDVVNETSYGYTYSFPKDGATWSVSVKTSPEVWELVGEEGIKELFIGLGPNAK